MIRGGAFVDRLALAGRRLLFLGAVNLNQGEVTLPSAVGSGGGVSTSVRRRGPREAVFVSLLVQQNPGL